MNPLKYFEITLAIFEKIWIFLAIAVVAAIFSSACWWRKHDEKPSSALAALLPFAGIRTRKVLFCGTAAVIFLSLLPLFVLIPFVIAFSLPFASIANLLRKDRDLHEQGMGGLLFIAVLMLLLSLGLLAPLHLLAVGTYFISGQPAGGTLEALVTGKAALARDTVIGYTGLFAISLLLFLDSFRKLRQARQADNLPASKVRSLAQGLVELKGYARSADNNAPITEPILKLHMDIFESFEHKVVPFYLEDETGRVLVDPGRSYIKLGWITDLLGFFTGFHEIVLSRRVSRNAETGAVTRALIEGDLVYVIGNAETDTTAGTGQLVIRPKSARNIIGRDIYHVFFISDAGEERAKRHIMRGARRTWLLSLGWLIVSLVLIWSASLPARQEAHPESWRSAHWRGPEPGSDDSVDYSRDMRLFRFEKYVSGLKPDSYEAIPALVEAIGYENTRFREPATRALLAMLPAVREQSRQAVPYLIENLGDRRAQVIQLSITALGKFGGYAGKAVPALIRQLGRTEKTNTYEISPEILRHDAAAALGEIGPAAKEALPALREASADPSPYVRDAAERAIRKISK